jgi:hypothetical protein
VVYTSTHDMSGMTRAQLDAAVNVNSAVVAVNNDQLTFTVTDTGIVDLTVSRDLAYSTQPPLTQPNVIMRLFPDNIGGSTPLPLC